MQLNYQNRHKSIDGPVANNAVSDFIILSGPNGSGKSNLLESLQNGAMQVDGISLPIEKSIRMFKLSELMRDAEPEQTASAYPDNSVNLVNDIENYKLQYSSHPHNFDINSQDLNEQIKSILVSNHGMTFLGLNKMEAAANKQLMSFSQSDFKHHAPLFFSQRDPFKLSVSEIFLSYHNRRNRNDIDLYLRDNQGRTDVNPLTPEEFTNLYGRPPWDLLNQVLIRVGLENYSFNHPEGSEENSTYQPKLIDTRTHQERKVEDLSTGERTLLTIALTLYTGSEHGNAIELPELLLLDEADASLHPSMINNLLSVIKQIFVDQYKIKVILTTHSPTTVALAPLQSLYIMHREGAERLVKATSRDDALKFLTVGIPTLSVKLEDRRQIIVESEVDAECHDLLHNYSKNLIQYSHSLTFIASGRGNAGSCNAVKHIVTKFRGAGNDTVFGLIDRDARQAAPPNIHYSAERYSIENHILDPLALGLYLIRERFIGPEGLGLTADFRYFQYQPHAQGIIENVLLLLRRPEDDSTNVLVRYLNGSEVVIQKWYLEFNGHDLQRLIREKIRELNRLSESELMKDVINKIYREFPEIIPSAYSDLYTTLSE